jgi:hypothetical protein
MPTIINKQLAQKIAGKLGAQIEKSGAHQIAYIFHNNVLVAQFGIRHGSSKELGHDHVPSDIHLSPGKAKRLGQCPMSQAEWIRCLQEKGLIPADEPQQDNPPE